MVWVRPLILVLLALSATSVQAESRQNSVTGQVTILKTDGSEAKGDRSGVVVFLEPEDGVHPKSRPNDRPVISQRNQVFSPHVLVVAKGAEVRFPNDDDVFHNVFSLSRPRPFDLDIYAQGETRSVHFPNTGLVTVHCNIHPDMVSYILVLNNDLFSVTDASGTFAIPSVPDGVYRVRGWHEFGGEFSRTISLSDGASRTLQFEIQETRTAIQHKNKFGRPYSGKYK